MARPAEQGAGSSVVFCRREVGELNFRKLGEVTSVNEYLDKAARKGKLYVYMRRIKSGTLGSDGGPEKSIRRR